MPEYRRPHQPGGTFFFTVNLSDRGRRLLIEQIEHLRSAIKTVRTQHPFEIDAAVILPDHLHMIWTLPREDHDFSSRWRLIKSGFSRKINKTFVAHASRRSKGERDIWQRRFYDHLIRDENDFANHVNYIHFNPVKHRHVQRPIDWPHSSLHQYVKRGIVAADWGTSGFSSELDLD